MRDYSKDFNGQTYPCPLCERVLDIRITNKGGFGKNRVPYIVCNDCGVQMFIRYDKGIERLKSNINSWF